MPHKAALPFDDFAADQTDLACQAECSAEYGFTRPLLDPQQWSYPSSDLAPDQHFAG